MRGAADLIYSSSIAMFEFGVSLPGPKRRDVGEGQAFRSRPVQDELHILPVAGFWHLINAVPVSP